MRWAGTFREERLGRTKFGKDKVSVKPRAQDTYVSYTVEVMPDYDRRCKNSLFFVKPLSGGQAPKLITYK